MRKDHYHSTTPHRLIGHLEEFFSIENDRLLGEKLFITQSQLNYLRNGKRNMSIEFLRTVSNVTGWGLEKILRLAGIDFQVPALPYNIDQLHDPEELPDCLEPAERRELSNLLYERSREGGERREGVSVQYHSDFGKTNERMKISPVSDED